MKLIDFLEKITSDNLVDDDLYRIWSDTSDQAGLPEDEGMIHDSLEALAVLSDLKKMIKAGIFEDIKEPTEDIAIEMMVDNEYLKVFDIPRKKEI